MDKWIAEVVEDENGELVLEFPQDLVDKLGWQEGDMLNWHIEDDEVFITKKT